MQVRHWVAHPVVAHLVFALSFGCSSPGGSQVAPSSSAMPSSPNRFAPLSAAASPVSFERIASFPLPGWQVPRQAQLAPDGKSVTYLQSESGSDEMALFSFDLATKKASVLVRAADLRKGDAPRALSREEELRRERQRKRIRGITSYAWAKRAAVIVLPVGGNIWVRTAEGKLIQVTDDDVPDIDAKLNADGTRVAFARGRELMVADCRALADAVALTEGAAAGVTRGQSDFNAQEEFGETSGFWWSPTGSQLAYVEVDEREVATIPILGYREGTDLQRLAYPRAGGGNPTVELKLVSGDGGPSSVVSFPADERDSYLGRVRFSTDGQSLYVQRLSRDQRRLRLYRVDTASYAATQLIEQTDPHWLDFALFEPVGEQFVWSRHDENGHRHLALHAADGGSVRELTRGDWDVFHIDGLDSKKGRVLFTANARAPLDRRLYAVDLKSGERTPLSSLAGVHAVTANRPELGWIDIHSASDRHPRAEVIGPDGAVRAQLEVGRDADLTDMKLRDAETLTLEAEDGTPLYAAFLPPRNIVPGAKHPAVVMVYGGPSVQTVLNQWNPRLIWQHLADRGFAVIQIDNRGSAGRGHRFETAIHRKLGAAELADQLVAVDYLRGLDYVDPERVGIYGHSYGGYMATLAMLDAGDRFSVGVAGSPVTDWRYYDTGYTERYMDKPQDNAPGYDSSSLLPRATKLNGQLLVIHALMDENVHFEHTAALIDAFVAADKDFDLLVFPGERHGYRSPDARRYAYRRVVDYFVEHL
ncbi:MAG: alpha/beta fold hydrolase [Myxococcota bacterium]